MTATGPPRPDEYGADALIVCDNLVRIYQVENIEVQALQGLDLLVERGRDDRHRRRLGIGQVDPAQRALRARRADRRPRPGRRLGPAAHDAGRPARPTAAPMVGFVWQQTARNLLPYLTAVENVALPMAFAGRRRARAQAARRRAARRPRRRRQGAPTSRASCRAASSSGSRSPSRSPTGRRCSSPTSRPASSTRATGDDVFAALRAANTELGTTVVIVTHDAEVSRQVQRTVAIRDGRTSSEVVRRTEVDEHGASTVIAEEFAVLDRAGPPAAARGATARRSACATGCGSSSSPTTSASGRTADEGAPDDAQRRSDRR